MDDYKAAVRSLLDSLPRDPKTPRIVNWDELWREQGNPSKHVLRIIRLWNFWYHGKVLPHDESVIHEDWLPNYNMDYSKMILPKGGVRPGGVRSKWKETVNAVINNQMFPRRWNTWLWFNENRTQVEQVRAQMVQSRAMHAFTWEALAMTIALPLFGIIYYPGQVKAYLSFQDNVNFGVGFRLSVSAEEEVKANVLAKRGAGLLGNYTDPTQLEGLSNIFFNPSAKGKEYRFSDLTRDEEVAGWIPAVLLPDWDTPMERLVEALEQTLELADKLLDPAVDTNSNVRLIWSQEVVGWSITDASNAEVRRAWNAADQRGNISLARVFRDLYTSSALSGQERVSLRESFFRSSARLSLPDKAWEIGGVTLGLAAGRERERILRTYLSEEAQKRLTELPTGLAELQKKISLVEAGIAQRRREKETMEHHKEKLELLNAIPLEGTRTVAKPPSPWRLTVNDLDLEGLPDGLVLIRGSEDKSNNIAPGFFRGTSVEPHPGKEEVIHTMDTAGHLTDTEFKTLFRHRLQPAPSILWPPASDSYGPSGLYRGEGSGFSLHLDVSVALAMCVFPEARKAADDLFPEGTKFGLGRERADAELLHLIAPALVFRSTLVVAGLRYLADTLEEESEKPERQQELRWLVQALVIDELRSAPRGRRKLVQDSLQLRNVGDALRLDLSTGGGVELAGVIRNYANALSRGTFQNLLFNNHDLGVLLPDGPLLLLGAALSMNVRIHMVIIGFNPQTQRNALRLVVGAYYPPLNFTLNESAESEPETGVPPLGGLAPQTGSIGSTFQLRWVQTLQSYRGAISPELVWRAKALRASDVKQMAPPDNVVLLMEPRRSSGFRLLLSQKYVMSARLKDNQLEDALALERLPALGSASTANRIFSSPTLFEPEPLLLVPMEEVEEARRVRWATQQSLAKLQPTLYNHLQDVWSLRFYLPPMQLATMTGFHLLAWAASLQSESAYRWIVQNLERNVAMRPLLSSSPVTVAQLGMSLQIFASVLQESPEYTQALESDSLEFVKPLPVQVVFQFLVADPVWTGGPDTGHRHWQLRTITVAPEEGREGPGETLWVYVYYDSMDSRIQERPVLRLLVNDGSMSLTGDAETDSIFHKHPLVMDSSLTLAASSLSLQLGGPTGGNPSARGRHLFAALAQTLTLPLVRLAAPTLPGPAGAKAGESGATREPLSLSDITAVEKATAELIRNAARLFQTDSDFGREFLHTFGFENYTRDQLSAFATDLLEEAEELETQSDEGRYDTHARRTGSPLLYQPQNRVAAYHLAAASAATYDRKGEVRSYGVRLLIFEGEGETRLSLVHTIEPSEELVRIVHNLEAGEDTGKYFEYAVCMTQNSEAPQSWQYLPLVSGSQMGRLGLPLDGLEEVVEDTPESEEAVDRAQSIVETTVVEDTQEVIARPPSLSPAATEVFLSPHPTMSGSELVEVGEPEVEVGLAQLDFENAIQGGKSEDDELTVLTERVNAIMRALSTSHLPAPIPPEEWEWKEPTPEAEESELQQRVDDILERFGQLPDPFSPMSVTPEPPTPPPEVRLPSPPPSPAPTLTPLPPNTEPPRVEKLGEAELQENLTEADIERILSATKKHSQYEYENHSENILFRFRGYDYKSFILYTLAQSGEAEKGWLARFKEEVHAALMGLAPYRESTMIKDLQGQDQLIDSVWLMHDKSRPAAFKPTKANRQLEDARIMALRLLKGEDPNFPPGSVQQLRFLAKVADMNHKHWMPQLKELEAYLVGEASKIEAMLRGKEFNEELQIMEDVPVPPVRWISLDDQVQGLLVRNRALIQPLLFPKNRSKNPQALWAHLTPSLNGRGWVMTVAPGFSEMAELAKRQRGTKRTASRVDGIDAIPHIWVPVVQQQGIFMPNKPTSIFMWKTVFGQTKSGRSTTTTRAVNVPSPLSVEEQARLLNPLNDLTTVSSSSQQQQSTRGLIPEDERITGGFDVAELALRRLQRAQRESKVIPQPPWQGLDTQFGYEPLFHTWWRLTSPRPRTLVSPVKLENSPHGGSVFYGPVPVTELRMLTVLTSAVRALENELSITDIQIQWSPLKPVFIPAHPTSVEWQQVEESLMDRCAIIHLIESVIPPTVTTRDALDSAIRRGRAGDAELLDEFQKSLKEAMFVLSAANTDVARQYVSALAPQVSHLLKIREPVTAPEFNLGSKFYIKRTTDKKGFGNKIWELFNKTGNVFGVLFHLLRELDKKVRLTHDFFRPRDLSGAIDYETEFKGFNSAKWLPVLGRRSYFIPTWGAVIPVTDEDTGELHHYEEYDWFSEEKQFIGNSTYVAHTGSTKNYGLYAGQKIEPKQQVLRYSGLALSPEDIEANYPGATLADYFLSVGGEEGGIDARRFGNESRFANGELSKANRYTLGLHSALLFADRLEPSPMREAKSYPGILILKSYANRSAYPGEEVTFYYGENYGWLDSLPRINQRSYFLSQRGSLRTINLIDNARK